MIAEVHARDAWIFEGGRASTWDARLARADTLIWLDLPLGLRLRRVVWRTLKSYGHSRADLPEGCPERFDADFYRWIWNTRNINRTRSQQLYDGAPPQKTKYHLKSPRAVRAFVKALCHVPHLHHTH